MVVTARPSRWTDSNRELFNQHNNSAHHRLQRFLVRQPQFDLLAEIQPLRFQISGCLQPTQPPQCDTHIRATSQALQHATPKRQPHALFS